MAEQEGLIGISRLTDTPLHINRYQQGPTYSTGNYSQYFIITYNGKGFENWVSLVAQTVKNLPAMWGTWVPSPGQEDPLEEEMATHSSVLAGESHGQRSLAGYSSWGHKDLDMTEWLTLSLHIHIYIERDTDINLNHYALHLKLTHCQSTILQLKRKKKQASQLPPESTLWLFPDGVIFLIPPGLTFIYSFIYLFFDWRIIALQNFAVFCQTTAWISHRYTHTPSLFSLPPISLTIPCP